MSDSAPVLRTFGMFWRPRQIIKQSNSLFVQFLGSLILSSVIKMRICYTLQQIKAFRLPERGDINSQLEDC